MKTVIIANPKAAAGKVEKVWADFNRVISGAFGPSEVRMTMGPGDATRLVFESILDGYERVVVVGGDGTINEAVNGFFDPQTGKRVGEDVALAVVPGGTGGDFSRSIGLSEGSIGERLAGATARRVDLGRATLKGHDGREVVRHFINISSFGSSGLIVDKVNKTSKRFGGKLSFMWGTVKGLISYRNQRVRLRIDDTFEEEVVINTVAVANGRFFGGSMMIAPNAILDDGKFDIITIGDINLGSYVAGGRKLYAGKHLGEPYIRDFRGSVVTAEPIGTAPVLIDLDGEQPGKLPVRYEVVPKALELWAPWEYAAAT